MTTARLEELSDEELARLAIRDQDSWDRAIRILHQRITPRLRRYLKFRYGLDAQTVEDLTQEVWTRVHRHLHRYSDERSSLTTWIWTIASNLAVNELRNDGRSPLVLRSDLEQEQKRDSDDRPLEFTDESPPADPDDSTRRRRLRNLVEGAIEDLPGRYRSVIRLRHRQNLTYEEIASELSQPLGSVKSRLHRGRKELRALLAEKLTESHLPDFFDASVLVS